MDNQSLSYTPLDIHDLEKKQTKVKRSNIDTILLVIGIFTAAVLAILLFVLIQRKMNKPVNTYVPPQPTIQSVTPIPSASLRTSPTKFILPTIPPIPLTGTQSATQTAPLASPSSTLQTTVAPATQSASAP
ncbi:MAG: hypothetical protein Q7S61_06105 [bacterium]|nr:hypothetical protein [bacterium]